MFSSRFWQNYNWALRIICLQEITHMIITRKKLLQEKERLYKEALKKHDAIINELNKKDKLSSDRIEYLNKLNILLRQAINELRADLEVI